MSLQDALRRAAGLLVELPPDAPRDDRDELLDEVLAKAATQSPGGSSRQVGATGSASGMSTSRPSQTKTVEQIMHDADGPDLDQIKAGVAASSPSGASPSEAGKALDAPAIYAAAKLPAAPFSAEQMLDMLASLPSELPLETRRQTVKVTLSALGKTMGASPETIVADASRKVAALAAYSEHLTKRTNEFSQSGEKEIEGLQSQIEAKRKALQDARHQLAQSTEKCRQEADRLDDVLEFFSLDVPPSKYAPRAPATGNPQISAPQANTPQANTPQSANVAQSLPVTPTSLSPGNDAPGNVARNSQNDSSR